MEHENEEDIFLWDNGDWCYRHEYNEGVAHYGDDEYRVIEVGSEEYLDIEDDIFDEDHFYIG